MDAESIFIPFGAFILSLMILSPPQKIYIFVFHITVVQTATSNMLTSPYASIFLQNNAILHPAPKSKGSF